MIDLRLIHLLRGQFALQWTGVHGLPHWTRVRENGLRLAKLTGANEKVIELFAFLHDSRRLNNYIDPEHGLRGAEFARSLAGKAFQLEPRDLELLVTACRYHSDGQKEGDITVQTCWDADRLDLGRVGIEPSPVGLCTEAARDPKMIEWAYQRSIAWRDG
jgi:uncharacterized protein